MTTATLTWSGSTAGGPAALDTGHAVDADGDGPEAALLAAVASCQLQSFLNVAARARLEVVAYADAARLVVDRSTAPARIEAVELRPRITVVGAVRPERLARLVELAHRDCTIAAALAVPVRIEASAVAPA